MRLIEHDGKKAWLTEAEWKGLLERFDSKNFVEQEPDYYENLTGCNLCKKHKGNCNVCPLGFEGDSSCIDLMYAVLGDEIFSVMEVDYISCTKHELKSDMQPIYEALLALPKVRRRK